MRTKYRSSTNVVPSLEAHVKNPHPSLKIVKRNFAGPNLPSVCTHTKLYIDSKRDAEPVSSQANQSEVSAKVPSAKSRGIGKGGSHKSIKSLNDSSEVIMQKLRQITNRVNDFISNDRKSETSKQATRFPEIKKPRKDFTELSETLRKSRTRWSDAGLLTFKDKSLQNDHVRAFNLDGIHFEVSVKSGQLTSSYSPHMNLIHYDFARGPLNAQSDSKQSPKSKPTDSQFPQPQLNKKEPTLAKASFKLKPLMDRERTPPLTPITNHCNLHFVPKRIVPQKLASAKKEKPQERMYKKLRERILDMKSGIQEGIDELSSEEEQ